MNPEFQVRWLDPKGAAVYSERVRMSPGGHVSSTLRTANAALRATGTSRCGSRTRWSRATSSRSSAGA